MASAYCSQPPAKEPVLSAWYFVYTCSLAEKWDEFAAHVDSEITLSDDGLWQPITDDRIRAVMLMAPDGAWLYSQRGLAGADRPVFLFAATEDEAVPYQFEPAYIFDHLGTSERFLVSFVGKDHMMVFNPEQAQQMRHFAVAFFGYYLHGHQELAEYFSEEYVNQQEGLFWGVYSGK